MENRTPARFDYESLLRMAVQLHGSLNFYDTSAFPKVAEAIVALNNAILDAFGASEDDS